MLILFDHSAPAPMRYALSGHIVIEAAERGWERLFDGTLLDAAEAAGFQTRAGESPLLFWETLSSGFCGHMLERLPPP